MNSNDAVELTNWHTPTISPIFIGSDHSDNNLLGGDVNKSDDAVEHFGGGLPDHAPDRYPHNLVVPNMWSFRYIGLY